MEETLDFVVKQGTEPFNKEKTLEMKTFERGNDYSIFYAKDGIFHFHLYILLKKELQDHHYNQIQDLSEMYAEVNKIHARFAKADLTADRFELTSRYSYGTNIDELRQLGFKTGEYLHVQALSESLKRGSEIVGVFREFIEKYVNEN